MLLPAAWCRNDMANEKDNAVATLEQVDIKAGERWRHYKGGEYEIVTCAIMEDTLEPLVVYRSIARGGVWARTLSNWHDNVDFNGRRVNRFERLKV